LKAAFRAAIRWAPAPLQQGRQTLLLGIAGVNWPGEGAVIVDQQSIVRPIRAGAGTGPVPTVDPRKKALSQAKRAAAAYFGIAVGYALALIMAFVFNINPLDLHKSALMVAIMSAVVVFAGLMGAWTVRQPGIIKAAFALAWGVLELVGKIVVMKSAMPTRYWLNALICYWAVVGLIGAIQLMKLKRNPEPRIDVFN
jgi:hypothetical protein